MARYRAAPPPKASARGARSGDAGARRRHPDHRRRADRERQVRARAGARRGISAARSSTPTACSSIATSPCSRRGPGRGREARAPHRLYRRDRCRRGLLGRALAQLALAEIAAARAGGAAADPGRRHRALSACAGRRPGRRSAGAGTGARRRRARSMPNSAAPPSARARRARSRRGGALAGRRHASASSAPMRWWPRPAGRSPSGSAAPPPALRAFAPRDRAAAAARRRFMPPATPASRHDESGAFVEVAALRGARARPRDCRRMKAVGVRELAGFLAGGWAANGRSLRRSRRPAATPSGNIPGSATAWPGCVRATISSAIFGKFISRNIVIYSSVPIDRQDLAL